MASGNLHNRFSLGMRHDGRADLNDCDPGGFLMSPTLSGSRNSWSSSSNKYLKRFLRSTFHFCSLESFPLKGIDSRAHFS